ncbi:MAG: alpha/beta fold hydrolase [Actinomycetota bacterium]|nr:alpha/beta fold hydrolase [Actinomycetota bacterium]
MSEVLRGAEPFSAEGGRVGVLVVHGFTGCPQSMRPLAEALAGEGFTVELPRLPGHGTSIDDMLTTRWADWSAAAEDAYRELAARCDRVVVTGLSMGGTLTLWLATRHPEIAGIVPINAAAQFPPDMREGLTAAQGAGAEVIDAVGGDIADPDATELAYDKTPVAPLLSLLDAVEELADGLASIRCPALVVVSDQDHVVEPSSSDVIAERVSGPVEVLRLARSYHVATLDHDRDLIAQRAIEFVRRVTDGAAAS